MADQVREDAGASEAPPAWLFASLGAAAIALRFVSIGQESFWTDEINTLKVVRDGFWRYILQSESTPPLSFALIKAWSLAFGTSHVALRAFSAVVGGLCAPAMLWAAGEWRLSRSAAVVAAAAMALNPFAFWVSQQNRYYALLMLASTLWLGALARLVRGTEPRPAWSLVMAGFLGFATHYYFAFVMAAAAVFVALSGGMVRSPRRMAATALALAVACALLLPLFLHQRANSPASFLSPPTVRQLLGVYPGAFSAGPRVEAAGWRTSVSSAAIALGCAGAVVGWRRRAGSGSAAGLAIGILGPALAFAVSRAWQPIFIADRYMIAFLPGWILGLAGGWAGFGGRGRTVALGLGCALTLAAWMPSLRHYMVERDEFDWQGLAARLERERAPGEPVLFCPGWLRMGVEENGPALADPVLWPGRLDEVGGAAWIVLWKSAPESSGVSRVQEWLSSRPHGAVMEDNIFAVWRVVSPEGPRSPETHRGVAPAPSPASLPTTP